jgi:hypothetical protein
LNAEEKTKLNLFRTQKVDKNGVGWDKLGLALKTLL